MMHQAKAGIFCVQVGRDGLPVWSTLFCKGKAIVSALSYDDLLDLQYVVGRAAEKVRLESERTGDKVR